MKKLLLLLILFYSAQAAFAQKEKLELDSMLRALKVAKEDTFKVKLLNSIAIVYWVSDHAKSRQYANATLQLSERLQFTLGKGVAHNSLANIESDEDNLPGAMEHYIVAAEMFKKAGYELKTAAVLVNIGHLYYQLKNDSAALFFYNEGVRHSEKHGATDALGGAYCSVGTVLSRQKKKDEALAYFFRSLAIREAVGDKPGLTAVHRNIGMVYMGENKFDDAIKHTELALQIAEDINYKLRIAECYNSLGLIYGRKADADSGSKNPGRYLSSIEQFEKSSLIAREINARRQILTNYEKIKLCYSRIHDHVNRANIAEKIIKLKDSISSDESASRIEKIRLGYENEKLAIETKAKQDKTLSLARLLHVQQISAEQMKHGQELTDEKLRHEEEQLRQKARIEKTAYIEKAGIERTALHQKIKQDKLLAQQDTRNNYLLMSLILAVVVVSSSSLFFREKRLKRRAVERADAMHQMAELELQSLRTQLNPHFMFNSLNAIQELILMEDNERSHVYLSRFSKLLRILLENATMPFIPLSKELGFLNLYLSLENLRIPDLVFSIDVEPGIDSEAVMIPNMILQPYIENAIWHGLSHLATNRHLRVTIATRQAAIVCSILDNGVGRRKSAELKSSYRKGHNSKGMELLSKRFSILSQEYGQSISVHFTDLEDEGEAKGTLVEITIPFALSEPGKLRHYDSLYNN